MLNKYYFSSANRLLCKNTGHGVKAYVSPLRNHLLRHLTHTHAKPWIQTLLVEISVSTHVCQKHGGKGSKTGN